MTVAPALRVSDLTKDFGGLRAVDQISFQVEEGEFVGLIDLMGAENPPRLIVFLDCWK